MTELYDNPRPRITASMLPRFVGKNVTMLGTVDPGNISSDGSSFKLQTDEKTAVRVTLNAPLNEMLDDLVEVTGTVDNQCNLSGIVYHKVSSNVPFDFEEYNNTIDLMHRFPNLCTYK
uniref:Replication protein A 14 kDa subunit-like n=1 Tax=Phallusia mammillata TaxID=59560 RepID=A0A6F9DQF7_9ASCI|nr:replication protein A 14 kDa subunit-like [Phallusia mammillata]